MNPTTLPTTVCPASPVPIIADWLARRLPFWMTLEAWERTGWCWRPSDEPPMGVPANRNHRDVPRLIAERLIRDFEGV